MSGLPVVAADNQGYVTVLTGLGQECLVAAGRAEELTDAIVRMAGNVELRGKLSHWGRTHALQFDIRFLVTEFENFYIEAISRHRKSASRVRGSEAVP